MKFDGKKYVTPAAVANKWGCCESTVLKYSKKGLIPGAFKYNGHWYILLTMLRCPSSVHQDLGLNPEMLSHGLVRLQDSMSFGAMT